MKKSRFRETPLFAVQVAAELAPLAERMRPRTREERVGQGRLLATVPCI